MEKKYYDLIISLIKQHRKYSGCESILEDIANDVYEHAKVVINSVSNEDVVIAYLNKVVSTSIVTVPRKLNLNTKKRNRIVTTLPITTTEVVIDNKGQHETLVENTIEEKSLDVTEDFSIDSPVLETESDLELEAELNFEENTIEIQEIEQEDIIEETAEDISTEVFETEEVDITLVDKMINGIQNTESSIQKEETAENDNSNEEDNLTEIYDSLEEVEAIEESFEELDFTETEIIEETNEELQENTEAVERLEEVDTPEIIDSTEELEVISEASVNNENFIENSSDETESLGIEEIIEEISPLETIENIDTIETFELEDSNLDDFENIINNDETLESNEDSIEELTEEEEYIEIDDAITEEGNNQKELTVPSFECFNFEPQKTEFDKEEIFSYLKKIDEKHPEKQILMICDLKYNQKLSIEEISKKLGFSTENIIEILNEIIKTVKD